MKLIEICNGIFSFEMQIFLESDFKNRFFQILNQLKSKHIYKTSKSRECRTKAKNLYFFKN